MARTPTQDNRAEFYALSRDAERVAFLEERLDLPGRVRAFKTEVDNPTQQLKNRLNQAHSIRDALVLFRVLDERAFEIARKALKQRWGEKEGWPKNVACVALAYPLDQPIVRTIVEWKSTDFARRLADLLAPVELVAANGSPASGQTGPEAIATPEHVFIEESEYDTLLELLGRKKNLILQGPPGVGKTFIARTLAYSFIGERAPERVQMVQFHQSYGYEDFVQGWRPASSGGFQRTDGIFYDFCKRAAEDATERYVFIVDEINRGNVSKIFGELMALLEADKRGPDCAVPLAYHDKTRDQPFFVPENVHLLGLMNTADRSLGDVPLNVETEQRSASSSRSLHHAVNAALAGRVVSA